MCELNGCNVSICLTCVAPKLPENSEKHPTSNHQKSHKWCGFSLHEFWTVSCNRTDCNRVAEKLDFFENIAVLRQV